MSSIVTMPSSKINPELQNERDRATFDVHKLTYLLDGGKERTDRRRYIQGLVINDPDLQHRPYAYMGRDEQYSTAMKLVTHTVKKTLEFNLTDPYDLMHFRQCTLAQSSSPLALHTVMFIPALKSQCTPEQLDKYLPMAERYEMIGTYAQTEMGHGTFVRGLETTATYDPSTQEFILNSPTLTSLKWWPGNLGKTTNHVVVMATLFSRGKNCGMQPFLLQTRSLVDHKPLPGISLGDIGPKLAYAANDNGFMGLDNVRIPRENMLMKNAEVKPDGTFIQKRTSKLTYGVMVFIRAALVYEMGVTLAKGVTIALRYSTIRRQSEMEPGGAEPKILEYQTQQHKLFPLLASAYAFWFAGMSMLTTYMEIQADISDGNTDRLPELHALSCGLKALTSWVMSDGIETCRMSCGGHGYSQASGLPAIHGNHTPACTYEGENTVMMLQTARYLVKAFAKAQSGQKLPGFVSYMTLKEDNSCTIDRSMKLDCLVMAYRHRAARLVRVAATKFQSLLSEGKPRWEAWNMTSVELAKCAGAHSHCYIVQNFVNVVSNNKLDPPTRRVLTQLCKLYALHGISQNSGDFLADGFMSGQQLDLVNSQVLALLAEIRPNAVPLVDAFDFPDRLLDSVLGRYDGQVYENLFKWAQESPMNEKEVNDAHFKYVKPLQDYMKSKL